MVTAPSNPAKFKKRFHKTIPNAETVAMVLINPLAGKSQYRFNGCGEDW